MSFTVYLADDVLNTAYRIYIWPNSKKVKDNNNNNNNDRLTAFDPGQPG